MECHKVITLLLVMVTVYLWRSLVWKTWKCQGISTADREFTKSLVRENGSL